MSKQEILQEAYGRLNAEQREAVESLDGPVLVVAGPGTGKTQLLSLRVANILESRDVAPENILCLTFTDAGAEAMTQRLAGFIGRDAYAVPISTFHSFAAGLRNRFPEYFERSAFDRQVTDLQAKRLVNRLLSELSTQDPLYQNPQGLVFGNYGDVFSLINDLERSGLGVDEMLAIAEQNRAFFTHVENSTHLLEMLDASLPSKDKDVHVENIRAEVNRVVTQLPPELTASVTPLPGSYLPYGAYLAQRFNETELYEDNGKTVKTSGFQALRDELFEGRPRTFKDKRANEKMVSAVRLYGQYRAHLHKQGLYDYQDMINDAVKAIEESAGFQRELQERYRYILIDEFQDTNGSQMHLVDLLTEGVEQPNILAVGDDDQSIMRFQGASVEFINQFEQHYACGVKRIVLKTNYRSTPSLVALGQTVARQIENRSPASQTEKHLQAHRTEDEPATFTAQVYQTPEMEYYAVAEEIAQLIEGGYIEQADKPEEALAVIAGKNKNLRALIPYLQLFEVPFTYKITNAVSEIASLQTMLALLRFVMHRSAGDLLRAQAWLPQIIASKELAAAYGLSHHDILAFAVEARKEGDWFATLESSERPAFRHLHAWLQEQCVAAVTLPVRQVLYDLSLPLQHYYDRTNNEDLYEIIEFNYGLKALLEFVSEEEASRAGAGTSLCSLRLTNLAEVLDDANAFLVDIEARIPAGKEGAIVLTTAHSSKGKEYDLVFLLDGDDASWHGKGKTTGLTTKNMLVTGAKDEDDHRRLLFVALTRAKTQLRITQAKPAVMRELLDDVDVEECKLDLFEQAAVSEESWEDRYKPRDATLKELAEQALEGRKLSASMLNDFVEFPRDTANLSGEPFLLKQILRLPQAPNISAAFGTIVHDFFEEYLTKVVIAQNITMQELVLLTHRAIELLDFEQAYVEHRHQYFDAIVEKFLPQLGEMLARSQNAQAERWFAATVGDVPLTGKVDLLLVDSAQKSLEIYDYKTTKYEGGTLESSHVRQLRFYRLLLENSPEFAGWSVRGGADLYVMPQKDLDYNLPEVRFLTVSDDELEHVRALSAAVWYRLQCGLFDTSGFLKSSLYAQVLEQSVYKSDGNGHKKGDPKPPRKEELQSAYEQWLIEEHIGLLAQ